MEDPTCDVNLVCDGRHAGEQKARQARSPYQLLFCSSYVALANLETPNVHQASHKLRDPPPSCLCLPSVGIKGVEHHS